jgi:glycosyltransferase involved in cell wall biosynthesis
MAATAPIKSASALPPLVSVLTPFYNEEPYLRECVDSVLAQSYPHFELILVDNASTDGSRRIAEEYVRRDTRVRLLACDQHVSMAENLNRAAHEISPQAKYVKYCFGDDWLYPTCIEQMVAKLETNPRVGSVCAYVLVDNEVFPFGPRVNESVMSGREAARRYLLTGRPMFGTVTASMFRAEAVREHEQFFNPHRAADDIEPEMDSFLKWDFAFIHQILSFARRQRATTSTALSRLMLMHASPLICLHKYGARFLTPTELAERRKCVAHAYGRDVAEGMARTGFVRVLRAHRTELARAGIALPVFSIARGLLTVGLKMLWHPYRSYRALLRERNGHGNG